MENTENKNAENNCTENQAKDPGGIPYIEPRMLKLTEIDFTHYLKLCDVEKLLRDMRKEILDNSMYELNEDGTRRYHHTETEMAVLNALYFVSSCIKRGLVMQCESPEEIRELHERIRARYWAGKYYLSEKTTDDDGKPQTVYFRKYCTGAMAHRMQEEGKTEAEIAEAMETEEGDPVFTTDKKYVRLFESMEEAMSHRTYLNHNYRMNLEVCDAFLLDGRACKRFLDELLGGKGDGEPERTED